MRRRIAAVVAVFTATALVAAVSAGLAPAAGPHTCSGTLGAPGLLKGSYRTGVIVKGVCAVKTGKAHVFGTLTVTRGSALGAAFGRHHASLTLTGNLVVDKGAIVLLGCKANPDGTGSPCLDDSSMNHPTLTSRGVVSGNLIEHAPLAVIVHNSTIGGSVTQSGGGGGLSCKPPTTGIFAKIGSPVFSDYEDSSVGHSLAISKLKSCWLGVARVKVGGNLSFTGNQFADPDAIEILANHVGGNLSCAGNSSVWDSTETSMTANFPRAPEPNTVKGKRSGQCVLATPTTNGGSSGPGPF
jgi:hypothetical protein